MRRTATIVLALVLSGCISARDANVQIEPSTAEVRLPTPDEFWMITIAGTAQHDPRDSFSPCEDRYPPDEGKLERQDATVPRDEVQIAILFLVVYKVSRCPLIDELILNEWDVTRRLAHMGDVRVEVRADGSMRVAGHDVALGEEIHVRTPQGDPDGWIQYVGVNRGAWPRSGITP